MNELPSSNEETLDRAIAYFAAHDRNDGIIFHNDATVRETLTLLRELKKRLAHETSADPEATLWVVLSEHGRPMHVTVEKQMAHDHINECIIEHKYGGLYRVVEVRIVDSSAQKASARPVVESYQHGEMEDPVALANRILDRPFNDPDDELAIMARQFMRRAEWAQAWHKLCENVATMLGVNSALGLKEMAPEIATAISTLQRHFHPAQSAENGPGEQT